jgi:hypothetical protein
MRSDAIRRFYELLQETFPERNIAMPMYDINRNWAAVPGDEAIEDLGVRNRYRMLRRQQTDFMRALPGIMNDFDRKIDDMRSGMQRAGAPAQRPRL